MPHSAIINSLNEILPRQEKRALGLLQVFPENVTFDSQNPGEEIFIMLRSHFATNIGWIIRFVLGFFLPFLIFLFLQVFNQILFAGEEQKIVLTEFVTWEVIVIAAVFYFTVLITFFLTNFIDWYYDIYLVTNERLIHLDFQIFTGKFIAEAPLINIEDISQNVVGVIPTMFHYGDVLVQTAAQKNKFFLQSVPDPNWFGDVLADLSTLAKRYEKELRLQRQGTDVDIQAKIPVKDITENHSHRFVEAFNIDSNPTSTERSIEP